MKISKLLQNETDRTLVATSILTLLAFGSTVLGQSTVGEQQDYTSVASSVDYHIVGQNNTVRFVTAEMGFHGNVVKNAPYSAEAVTTVTQTLADGNQINREAVAVLYRDSEGRTRREQTLTGIGPWVIVSQGQVLRVIVINDPVAGVSYSLTPSTLTAVAHDISSFKSSPMQEDTQEPSSPEQEGNTHETTNFTASGTALSSPLLNQYQLVGMDGAEFLGTRTIEGVAAEGTRSTIIIPAGSIGNEQPIEVISERWYSSELQSLVMSRYSDPRFGETVYQLKNISLAEPSSDLFEVPLDYDITEGSTILEAIPLMPY